MTYPEIIVFNQEGKYLKYKSVQECNASAFKFIDSLNNNKNYPIIDTFLLEKFENSLVNFQGKKKESILNKTTDFYVLIFWAEWTGKLNKDHTYIWEQKAKNNKNCNIKTIKIKEI